MRLVMSMRAVGVLVANTIVRGRCHVGPALALIVFGGCYPVARMQTPRTTPRGRVHVALGAGLMPENAYRGGTDHPTADVGVRFGLLERLDFSVRIRPVAFEGGIKLQLLRDDVELSIAPVFVLAEESASFSDANQYADRNVEVMAGRAAVYVGTDADERVAFWAAPMIDAGRRSFDNVDGHFDEPFAAPGGACGLTYAWGESFRQQLELAVLVPVAGKRAVPDGTGDTDLTQTRLGPGDVRVELQMAFLFGSYAPKQDRPEP